MLMQELWGAEYFTNFAIFNDGLLGAIFLFVFFWSFTFLAMRGEKEMPAEAAMDIVIPPVVTAFFLFAFNIHPFIIGILVLVAYLVTVKLLLKPEWGEWFASCVFLVIMLTIFAIVDGTSRWILFGLYLVIGYFVGEKRLRDKKEEKKKDE